MSSYPPAFGPYQWRHTHLQAARLDELVQEYNRGGEKEKDHRIDILHKYLGDTPAYLGCIGCVVNAKMFIDTHPLPVVEEAAPGDYFKWSVEFHNHANEITGKRIVSLDEAKELFVEQWRNYEDMKQLGIAQLNRLEDHRKIESLEKQIKGFVCVQWLLVALCLLFAAAALYFMLRKKSSRNL